MKSEKTSIPGFPLDKSSENETTDNPLSYAHDDNSTIDKQSTGTESGNPGGEYNSSKPYRRVIRGIMRHD